MKTAIGFLNVKDKMTIRSYAVDGGGPEENQVLATKRANAIMRYMKRYGVDYNRLVAVGYSHDRYFNFSEIESQVRQHGQASYFFIYKENSK